MTQWESPPEGPYLVFPHMAWHSVITAAPAADNLWASGAHAPYSMLQTHDRLENMSSSLGVEQPHHVWKCPLGRRTLAQAPWPSFTFNQWFLIRRTLSPQDTWQIWRHFLFFWLVPEGFAVARSCTWHPAMCNRAAHNKELPGPECQQCQG